MSLSARSKAVRLQGAVGGLAAAIRGAVMRRTNAGCSDTVCASCSKAVRMQGAASTLAAAGECVAVHTRSIFGVHRCWPDFAGLSESVPAEAKQSGCKGAEKHSWLYVRVGQQRTYAD